MRRQPAGDASSRRVLLVEGPDDFHLLNHLLDQHGLADQFDLVQSGGNEQVFTSLRTRLKFPSLERLGIMLDADPSDEHADAVAQLWHRIRDALHRAGFRSVPEAPLSSGTIIRDPEKPVVGVWLMPDNTSPGMLEDFCRFLIPDSDPLWPHATQAVQTIPIEERRFPARNVAKANLHTWLAWQNEPGKPIGQAITKRYLDGGAPHGLKLIAWLRDLFALDAD
jgi:hypothetical protein